LEVNMAILLGILILAVIFLAYKVWSIERAIRGVFSNFERRVSLLDFFLCR
jgi:hypothetical protein